MPNTTTTRPQQQTPQNQNAPINQGQLVPEAVLKRRHDMDEMKAKRAAQLLANPRGNRKIFSKSKKTIVVHKPERFVLYNRNKIGFQRRFDRVERKGMQKRASKKVVLETKVITAENEEGEDRVVKFKANSIASPFLFVVRVRTRAAVPRCVAKVLTSLRLRNQYDGVFLHNTPEKFKQLQLVDPFVIYGIPSKQTVLDLIKRRGHASIKKERIPLSDNVIIEKELGKYTGIICVEDLVEAITSAEQTNAERAMRFLWPFKFAAIYTKFQKMVLNEKDNKEYGDIGERMDEYIRKML